MKKILITGADSYIGTSFEMWLKQLQYAEMYQVDTVDMKGSKWKNIDFFPYDSIFHVAGIAHADIGNITDEQKKLYYKVNCDLALETAEKAMRNGVKQFIYMSSIIIYGESSSIRKKRIITKDTEPSPSNFYGDSKWQAEQKLQLMKHENFQVAIIRAPMIYGKGCKGNYKTLEKIAKNIPIFPNIENERSMLHIDMLCEFIRLLINSGEGGVFFPQDNDYVKTTNLVKSIAESNGKRIYTTKCFNWLIYLLGHYPGRIGNIINKAFGNLIYEKEIMLHHKE